MVATPLNRRGGSARRALSSVVVGGLASTTAAAVARRWGWRRSGIAAATVGAVTAAIEQVGTTTGVPFGRYAYSGALRPQIGDVPVVVPAAWFAMAVPAREVAHGALASRSTPARRVAAGAVALTAWDLFLDPQMVGEGYWAWARRGRYRGVPMSNYLGWLVSSAVVMGLLEVLLPVDDDPARDGVAPPSGDLVAGYGIMAVMETVGFAAFFRDRLVAKVGGAVMVPIAVVGAVGTLQALRGGRS